MDRITAAFDFIESLVRKLPIVALVAGAIVAGWLYVDREPSAVELLQQVNPGWTVVAADGRPVRVDDASGRGDVMISGDDLGPSRIRRVDCDEVKKLYPAWFALPDVPIGNCARLDGEDGTRWVLNVTTPMTVAEIWDRHFGPLLDRLQIGYGGGRSGRFPEGAETDLPAGQTPPEERGAGGYIVDPRPGSGERPVAIAFYADAGTTELIFTFRPVPPP
jgi:hypothetical protein